jgi:hypothetical protein
MYEVILGREDSMNEIHRQFETINATVQKPRCVVGVLYTTLWLNCPPTIVVSVADKRVESERIPTGMCTSTTKVVTDGQLKVQ